MTSVREYVHNGFKVGPNYCRPHAKVADHWIDFDAPQLIQISDQPAYWWTALNDPILNELVELGYSQNLSIRIAGARVLEARAERAIAAGNIFPQFQEHFAEYTRTQASLNSIPPLVPGVPRNFDLYSTGFNLAWELDIWGRIRRAIESADAQVDASIFNYDDVIVTLIGDVASTYVEYRTFETRLAYARNNTEIQEGSLKIVEAQFPEVVSELDVQQARVNLERTRALIPQLEIGRRQAQNRLCVLLGIPVIDLEFILSSGPELANGLERIPTPDQNDGEVNDAGDQADEDMIADAGADGALEEEAADAEDLAAPAKVATTAQLSAATERANKIPQPPLEAVVGIPADLLRRRPDVRRSEREVAAQSARIGLAEADLYPVFTINGTMFLEASSMARLFRSSSTAGAIGPTMQWNILNYGRIINNVAAEDARFRQAVLTYQNTVLQANQEAEDAIVGFLESQRRVEHLRLSTAAAERSVELARIQFREGDIDFGRVFVLEGALVNEQDALAQARADVVFNLINIYRALGGGWQIKLQGR